MHMKKTLLIGFVALLLLSIVLMVAPVSAYEYPAPDGGGTMWVEPDYVNGSEVGVGNTFVVEVKINISATAGPVGHRGMYAFSYWLTWNATLLTCTNANIQVWYPTVWGGHSTVQNAVLDDTPSSGFNTHSYAETAMPFDVGFNGTMTLARYNFTVASAPAVEVSSDLNLINKGFSDYDVYPITITVYDGLYVIPEFPAASIMLLFIVVTLIAVILGKKSLRRRVERGYRLSAWT